MARGKKSIAPDDTQPVEAGEFFAKLQDEGNGLVRGRVPSKLVRMLGGKAGDELSFTKKGGQWIVDIKAHHPGRRPSSAAKA